MKRNDIINHLIKTYGYKTYLEIGTQFGQCFEEIEIEHKVCIDPNKVYEKLTHEMTSDQFFEQNKETFDIIFVDGLHTEEQTTIDIHNSLKVLNEGGTIVVHDCLPHCEEFIKICWNGTVFRSIIDLRYKHPELSVVVVDEDCGCGIVRRATPPFPNPYNEVPISVAKSYFYYEQTKKSLMNVISKEDFFELFKG